MRVLQIHTAYRQAGGEDAVVAAEAAALRAAGHDVRALTATNPDGATAAAASLLRAPWNRAAARGAREAARRVVPDVVHLHNTWFAMSPSVAPAVADGPARRPAVVMTLHNYRLVCPAATLYHHGSRCHDCITGGPWRAVQHRCYRDSTAQSVLAAATVASWRTSGALGAVDRFIALSDHGRKVFLDAGLPADRVVVLPHGVDDPGPRPGPPSRSRDVLFVGRAVPEKGLDALIRLWGRRPRPLRLRVLGAGPVVDRWRDRAPDGVVLEGAVDRGSVREAMLGARALAVPSLWDEPFGLVAVEAMAAGLGVASTGLGALAGIHGREAGWLAGPAAAREDDATAWDDASWEALLGALDEDAAVDARGVAARRAYLDRYTPATALAGLVEVYEEAIASAADRPARAHRSARGT